MFLLILLSILSLVCSQFQVFNYTYEFLGKPYEFCYKNAKPCCPTNVNATSFRLIDYLYTPDYTSNFTDFLPDGFLLTGFNYTILGSFQNVPPHQLSAMIGQNSTSLKEMRTVMSVIFNGDAVQTDIVPKPNECCPLLGCYCPNCQYLLTMASENCDVCNGYIYDGNNSLTISVASGRIVASKATVTLTAVNATIVVTDLAPPAGTDLCFTNLPFIVWVHGKFYPFLFNYSYIYVCNWTKNGSPLFQYWANIINSTHAICDVPQPLTGATGTILTLTFSLVTYTNVNPQPITSQPFNYMLYHEPILSLLQPASGSPDGGDVVSFIGSGFFSSKALKIKFGDYRPFLDAHFVNETIITCIAPKQIGTSRVVVVSISENGGMDWTTGAQYTYLSIVPPAPIYPLWGNTFVWISITAGGCFLFVAIVISGYIFYRQNCVRGRELDILESIDSSVVIDFSEVELKERIGRGSFGDVFRGFWRYSEVAVKKIAITSDESVLQEILKEAKLMGVLRHPNITQLMGVCIRHPDICIITEFISRGNLYRVLHLPNIVIALEHLRGFALGVCKGMAYLHGAKIMHRDLKCTNILVDKDWNCKVSDFGLSRSVGDTTMTACGTPCWAAPEVLRNSHYSYEADVFSFGVCFWEMVTQQYPYHGRAPYQVVIAVATKGLRPEIPDSTPVDFSTIMTQCWLENPSKRPSFGDLIEAFTAMKLPKPFSAHPKISRKANPEKAPINSSDAPYRISSDPSPRSSRHSGLDGLPQSILDIANSLTNSAPPSPHIGNQSINTNFEQGDLLGDVLGSNTVTNNDEFEEVHFGLPRDDSVDDNI